MHVQDLAQAMLLIPLVLSGISFAGLFDHSPDRSHARVFGAMTILVSAIQLGLSVAMLAAWPPPGGAATFSLNIGIPINFRIDALSLYFILLVNIIAFTASWNTWAYLEEAPIGRGFRHPASFHGWINAFHLTMLLVPMLDNLVGLWIAIELTTLASAFLVGHRNTKDSWEAAWKYLVITSAGIILALLGTMFLAITAASDSATAMDWSTMVQLVQDPNLRDELPKLSFLFILIGYGAKAGLAPMHTWLPDGHGEAPAPISALLSGVLLKCALYAILRFYVITNAALGSSSFTSTALAGAGLLSLVVAVPFILKRNPFKRVLAYHSLEHMGIITFGLGMGGSLALFGALLHCLNHAVTKALMFLSFGNMTREYKRLLGHEPEEAELRGGLQAMPKTAVLLSLGGLALVGTPPFSVFTSEAIILMGPISQLLGKTAKTEAIHSDLATAAAVLVFLASTTLIFYGLIRHLARLVLHRPPQIAVEQGAWQEKGWRDLLPVVVLAALMLGLGLYIAPPLSALLQESVTIIQGR